MTEASLFVVFCADLQAWNRQPERYWPDVPAETRRAVLAALDGYYRDKPQVQRDEAMRSCALAAQTLMLAAQSLGYDSCPMTGFDFGRVGELIRLPADHVLAMAVASAGAWNPRRRGPAGWTWPRWRSPTGSEKETGRRHGARRPAVTGRNDARGNCWPTTPVTCWCWSAW